MGIFQLIFDWLQLESCLIAGLFWYHDEIHIHKLDYFEHIRVFKAKTFNRWKSSSHLRHQFGLLLAGFVLSKCHEILIQSGVFNIFVSNGFSWSDTCKVLSAHFAKVITQHIFQLKIFHPSCSLWIHARLIQVVNMTRMECLRNVHAIETLFREGWIRIIRQTSWVIFVASLWVLESNCLSFWLLFASVHHKLINMYMEFFIERRNKRVRRKFKLLNPPTVLINIHDCINFLPVWYLFLLIKAVLRNIFCFRFNERLKVVFKQEAVPRSFSDVCLYPRFSNDWWMNV